jgi:3-oxoacyl-[acyl-carrier protein] reductase
MIGIKLIATYEKENLIMRTASAIARYLAGVIFLVFGLNGFLHFIPLPPPDGVAGQFMGALFVSHYLSVVFALQVIAGVLLLVNRYVPLALAALAPVIVNILCFHALMAPNGLPLAVFVAVLWALAFVDVRSAFALLFQPRQQGSGLRGIMACDERPPMKTSIRTHEGRVALVTGAGQGIGQAIALALAERGAHVIATDLTPPLETVQKIGPSAHAFQLDVTKEEDWRSASVQSRDVGSVDIVVNNAGYFPNRSIDELDLATWRKTMATNLDAQFLSAKYFLPGMRKKKLGRFVGISSNMVGLAIPGMSHYIATKMGIIGFMRGLANDIAGDGITANAVLPGLTNTLATAPQSEERKRATWEQQAIKRLGEPEDMTGAVLFLTSDDASFITGQAIVVDGGQYRVG